jgi:hypothetical protein
LIISKLIYNNFNLENDNPFIFFDPTSAKFSKDLEDEEGEEDEPKGYFHKMIKKAAKTLKDEGPKIDFLLKKRLSRAKIEENKGGPGQKNINPNQHKTSNFSGNRKKDKLEKNDRNKNKNQKFSKNQKPFKPKQVCQFFIHGACHKGDDCTYSHDAHQIKKTELCKYFLTGNCIKGDDCLFSHNTKDFPCKYYHAKGVCEQAHLCK